MTPQLLNNISSSVNQFINWLENYGETSYDHQSFFAGPVGGRAKALYYKKPLLGTMAVAPMIFFEAFVPSGRKMFGRPERFPIADAHYAMGFSFLSQLTHKKEYYDKASHFLNILEKIRCPGYQNYCWGYPFNWETRNGTIFTGTPLITVTPYVYEAFLSVYQLDKNDKWLKIMRSIAEHTIHDIKDFAISSDASTCSYTPFDKGGVINASAYRAFLLTSASVHLAEEKYWNIGERNLNFVLNSQQPNGSWYYAIDGVRDFVDHFHTCFVLKALTKIEQLTGHGGCQEAIEKGVRYYISNLFDEDGLPKPFSKAPRLTVYKNELYDYAECVNVCVLLEDRFPELEGILITVLQDILARWHKKDGSFRSRKLHFGWDNVPMHRWAQSQLFRSLCFLLYQEKHIN
ncbi:MAG: hypothetical protein A3H98_10515 [Bacteroidetes bacterium RIFCSPLOWO2_02_FULL_36_8]|nr:MAG: hypothetical protein A3H98_10515 [Bacteroidetes bacterium RIFCSPLOWO2_02_FULL_36_8]